jgi:hypothetical protein
METALMGISEFDDVQAHLLEPEESLDSEQTGIDLDEGYSPPERPRELRAWGLTPREARTPESLARRLTREVPDVTDQWDGDGLGDSADSDGEPIDNQVGDMRAGRLVAFGIDPTDSSTDYLAHDVGIDGGAASAEEAAMHIVVDEDTSAGEGWRR